MSLTLKEKLVLATYIFLAVLLIKFLNEPEVPKYTIEDFNREKKELDKKADSVKNLPHLTAIGHKVMLCSKPQPVLIGAKPLESVIRVEQYIGHPPLKYQTKPQPQIFISDDKGIVKGVFK